MKHVLLFFVLIFSLLAVCNCTVEPDQNNVTAKTETEKTPTQKPETTEIKQPEVLPPEVLPPETIPPEVVPPVVILPAEVPPETIPPEVVPPENGTNEGETQDPESGETETTETETQEGEGEESEPEEGETGEGENQETETTEIENPIDDMPDLALLQINELRTEFSGLSHRTEYIEFKAVKSGSLEGLYLYSVMNNAQDIFVYIFPEIDVEAGEYITLHLRELDKFNCCDELRDDLTISGGVDSCPSARDLWVTGNTKLIDKNSIVYIQDANGKIMDAVILNEKPVGTWNASQTHFAEIAERLFNAGMWQSANENKPTPLDSVNTSAVGSSVYKSVSRYEGRENTHSAKDWYIAGDTTPGLPNK